MRNIFSFIKQVYWDIPVNKKDHLHMIKIALIICSFMYCWTSYKFAFVARPDLGELNVTEGYIKNMVITTKRDILVVEDEGGADVYFPNKYQGISGVNRKILKNNIGSPVVVRWAYEVPEKWFFINKKYIWDMDLNGIKIKSVNQGRRDEEMKKIKFIFIFQCLCFFLV